MNDTPNASAKSEPTGAAASPPSLAWRVHGWVLAWLRFSGGFVLVYPFVLLGFLVYFPYAFHYEVQEIAASDVVALAFVPLVTAVIVIYFGWFFRRKTRLPDAVVGLFTGTIYFLGGIGVALAVTFVVEMLTQPKFSIFYSKNGFELAFLCYLLCGLAAVLFAMKGKRRF